MWQALHEELSPLGLTVITVALDKTIDDARPWIEAAHATHPSLIDTEYALADLYNIVNVPTVLWIDETDRIVRPNDVHFVDETYTKVHGFRSDGPIAALRAWVRGEAAPYAGDAVADQPVPTAQHQLARAEFTLAWWLAREGRLDDAEPHFVRAGELAPYDFTIRRGSMLMRGLDPGGPDFFHMVEEWVGAGNAYYVPQQDLAPPARG